MKDRYIFFYITVLTVIVAALLSAAALVLQPFQEANVNNEKMMNILQAANVNIEEGANVQELFNKDCAKMMLVNGNGEVVKETTENYQKFEAFTLNLKDELYKRDNGQDFVLPIIVINNGKENVALPVIEILTDNEFFDYDAKYNGQVEEITPARLAPSTAERVAKITSAIYDILHCNGIIRIDYIISKNPDGTERINMLEVNTTPGMTVTSFIPQQVRAAGMEMKDVLTEIIENQF